MEFLNVPLPQSVLREEGKGNFKKAIQIVDELLKRDLPEMLKKRLQYEPERIYRLIEDYPFDEEGALEKMKSIGVNEDEFYRHVEHEDVDYLLVEGEKKFERRFLENFIFKFPDYAPDIKDDEHAEVKNLVNRRIDELIEGDKPKKYRVEARISLTLKKDYKGNKVRCWLPIPKLESPIERVDFVECNAECKRSRDDSTNMTVYMEGKPKAGTTFEVRFQYVLREQMNSIHVENVKNVDERRIESGFLREKPPHIVFSKYLIALTNEIVKDEKNPYLKAKRIYDWMTKNVDYSYMNPYSVYDGSLAEFAAVNLRGDCGVKALLFITMCRIAGIPAKWQSGWFITPNYAGPHDWAYFHVEPYGWLPADLSFGGARKDNEKRRSFYFGNMDAFRMVANSEFMAPFYPKKRFIRSDPYDNQVGEVETDKENIYYDGFDYKIEVLNFEEM